MFCPSCGKEIPDGGQYCQHCGKPVVVNISVPASPAQRKDPPIIVSLLLGAVLLIVIYGIAFFIGWNWTGSVSDLKNILALYQFGSMFIITLLAVPGINPEKRDFLRYVGVFILSVIPIADWIVIYWAGKGLARSLTQK